LIDPPPAVSASDGRSSQLRRATKRSIGCLGCITIPLGLALGSCLLVLQTICDTTWEDVASPDGIYVAVVMRDYCNLGATGSSVKLEVSVREQQNWLGMADSVSLVGMRRSGSRAHVEWDDSRTLRVEYEPHGHDAYPLYHVGPATWKDVQIRYRDLRSP
jgi:hypothetical protein